jgi:hypothetical protein
MLSVHFGRKANSVLPRNLFWANSPIVKMLQEAAKKCCKCESTIETVLDMPNEYIDGRLPRICSHNFFFGLEARSESDNKILQVFIADFLCSELTDSLYIIHKG